MRVGLVLGPDGVFSAPLQCQRRLYKALLALDTDLELIPIKGSVPKRLDLLHLDNLPFRWWEYARTYRAKHIIAHAHGNIVWVHPELTSFNTMTRARMKFTARLARRRLHHIFPVSQYLKNFLESWGVDPGRLTTIYNGLDPMYFDPPHDPAPVNKPYILHVSKYQPKKYTEILIRAFPRIRKEHPEIKLVIAGPGHLGGISEEVASGMEGVKFLGEVPTEILPRLYSNAEVFVFPSLHETFGLPVAEAMASSCPVVTTRRTCLPEIGGDAVMYASTNPISIANCVLEILGDPSLLRSLQVKGKERAKRFTWERAAKDVLRVYEEVGRG